DKLSRLGIKTEHIYDSTQPEINAFKPNPDGLLYIMKTLKLKKAECLMIGDRDDRDGECARRAGIDYCILLVGEKDRSRFVHNIFLSRENRTYYIV
ncbi:MAG: HAD-IA family hydrolase, partial [Selenomonas sp.]|nr:HAD-IA family hydrolase [Selenomonas sp.]